MTEIAKKRDEHFVEIQQCVGSAIVALGGTVSLLLHDSEEGVDQIKLIEYLCDTGKLLADVFHQQSTARKSFITPVMKKSVKPLIDLMKADEWLYGQKFAEQIKEAKTVEKAYESLKAQDKSGKKPFQRVQTQGNWRSPFVRFRQTGTTYRKQPFRFKPKTQYRSHQSSNQDRSSKETTKK